MQVPVKSRIAGVFLFPIYKQLAGFSNAVLLGRVTVREFKLLYKLLSYLKRRFPRSADG